MRTYLLTVGGNTREVSKTELRQYMRENDLVFEPNVDLYGLGQTIRDQGDACLHSKTNPDDMWTYGRVSYKG